MKTILLVLCAGLVCVAMSEEHGHGNELHVSHAARELMGLTTVKASKRRVSSTVGFYGRFELAGDARITASAAVAGRVTLKVKPMQRIKRGDVLFTVASPDLRSRKAELAILEKRLSAYSGVRTRNAELEAQVAVKRAELAAIAGDLVHDDGVVAVTASADAMVDAVGVSDGAWAEIGAAVVTLARTDRIRFRAQIPVSDAANLADGMSVEVDGRSGLISIGIADDSATVPVYAEFAENDPKWRVGTRCRALCETGSTSQPVVCVPESCLITIGLDPVVIVRDDDEEDAFVPVKVHLGRRGGGFVEVEGLPENAEVVKDGVYELKLALGGSNKKAGHFHADGQFHEGEHDHEGNH